MHGLLLPSLRLHPPQFVRAPRLMPLPPPPFYIPAEFLEVPFETPERMTIPSRPKRPLAKPSESYSTDRPELATPMTAAAGMTAYPQRMQAVKLPVVRFE
jgi:hypothetical protein